ncbi:cytochrome b [Armadillidium vulgare]|nr:cytochrome b [Armadillidium vulgare]
MDVLRLLMQMEFYIFYLSISSLGVRNSLVQCSSSPTLFSPFIILAIVFIHILFLHQTGSNNPGIKETNKNIIPPYFT